MSIENQADLDGLTAVGRIVALTIAAVAARLRPGVTTGELDRFAEGFLASHGARPAPRLVYGFPGAIMLSINDEAVHSVPGARAIAAGDLVKIDVTAELAGYVADAAETVAVPPVSALDHLFELGRLSSGKAAEMCGMNRVDFILLASRSVVPVADLDDAEREHSSIRVGEGRPDGGKIGLAVHRCHGDRMEYTEDL